MKTVSSLQRGMACLCCRKRKMKCDGVRPVCTQCQKSDRSSECRYHEKKHTSRTQILQQKVAKLEARLKELESEQADSSASSSSSSSSAGDAPHMHTTPFEDPFSSPSDYFMAGSSTTPSSAWQQSSSFQQPFSDAASVFTPPLTSSSSSESLWSSQFLDVPLSLEASITSPGSSHINLASLTSTSDCTPPNGGLDWWDDHNSFCDNKRTLLEIFFSHRHQCAFDVHTDRFKASLSAASNRRPHPALMDAIYLLACYFSRSPRHSELEAHFLGRALQGISDALCVSDRVVHVLQASCLLAVYFFCHARILEGYYHSSIAARLALDLGLHQVQSIDFLQLQMALSGGSEPLPGSVKTSSSLSPPTDAVEYAERVAAFWQIFAVDRAWSVATGLPTALPDDDHPQAQIGTAWPLPIVDVPVPDLSLLGESNHVHSLYDGNVPDHNFSWATVTLRAKAITLFERTARFSSSSVRNDVFWLEHRSLEMSLAQFSANLPCIGGQGVRSALSKIDIDLVNIHTLIYAATIHVNRAIMEIHSASYERCLVSANAITSIIRALSNDDYDFLDPINSTCWRCAGDVYTRILASPQTQALQCTVDVIDGELDVLIGAMQKLGTRFAVAGIHASKTEGDRIRARRSS
ncbi:hypothetical protein B0H21DRAFT_780844 [Amylocystis lapponica]|nr:hypothetical protein B0H21DRAFT_780844 [Amylocystis lapponica]